MPFLLLIIAISLVVLTWPFWSTILEAGIWIGLALLAVCAVIWLIVAAFNAFLRSVGAIANGGRAAVSGYRNFVYRLPPPPPPQPEPPTTPENWSERAAEAARRAEREREEQRSTGFASGRTARLR